MFRPSRIGLLVLVIAALAACHDGKSPLAASSTTTTAPSTTAPTTTTRPATTTSTIAGAGADTAPPPYVFRPAAGVNPPTGKPIVVPGSITHDCSKDTTDALERWIGSVPDGSVLQLAQGACYRIDGTVTISNRKNVLLDGQGATLKAGTDGDQGRRHLIVDGGSNITIRALTVQGANANAGVDSYRDDRAFQHAFSLNGVNGAWLDSVSANNVYGDFVYIGDTQQSSKDVTISGSQFKGSGRQGISVVNADGVLIEGNTVSDVGRSMFDLEPNVGSDVVRNVTLYANQTGAAKNFWIANKGAGTNIGDVTVEDNVMLAPTGGLVFVFGEGPALRGPFTFTGNRLIASDVVHDEGSQGAFLFAFARDVTLSGNIVQFQTDMPAVEARGSRGLTLEGNTFNGTTEPVLADSATSDVHS